MTTSVLGPIEPREVPVVGPVAVDDVAVVASEPTPTLARQVWPRDDAKVVQRALQLLARYDIAVGMVCNACQQGITAQREDHTGFIHLNCACCVRVQERTF